MTTFYTYPEPTPYWELPDGRVCIVQSSKVRSDWIVKYRGSIVAQGIETGQDHIETAKAKCLANKGWNSYKSFIVKGKSKMDSVDIIIHQRKIRAVVKHGEIMDLIASYVCRELRIPHEDFRSRCTIELRREGDSKWQAAVESSLPMPGDGQPLAGFLRGRIHA